MDPSAELQKAIDASPVGLYVKELLGIYVPIALELPNLRSDPRFMQEEVKATAGSGLTDVATAADVYAQSKIKEAVQGLGHNWQFWGEEGEDAQETELDPSRDCTVIVDPIEGTNNFKRKIDDQWGSVLALVDNRTKRPAVGIVVHPTKSKFYLGVKDGGAYELVYDKDGKLMSCAPMAQESEYEEFTYNNSPHFGKELLDKVQKFFTLGRVAETDTLHRSVVEIDKNVFVDPESGALEAVRYRGTMCFKTSNEMAAVFVILGELGGRVTDAEGRPWSMGISTLIASRNEKDYQYLKDLYDATGV